MNDYGYYYDLREEPKEVSGARKHLDEKIRYLKSELWDLCQILGKENPRATDEQILAYVEIEYELEKLMICDETLENVGQGVDRIVESAHKRSAEKIKHLGLTAK